MPCYYNEFRCIAGACRHSCCSTGWEIVIDEQTLDFYRALPEPERSRVLGAIAYDEEGCPTMGAEGGRCPFLNEEGLCRLILRHGEEAICEICALHPRYREWFPDRMEIGVGLCCEEAARLILSEPAPAEFETYLTDVGEEEEEDLPLYLPLLEARDRIFDLLQDRSRPLRARLASVLRFAMALQEKINRGEGLTGGESPSAVPTEPGRWQDVLSVLVSLHREMEYLDEGWQSRLSDLEEHLEELDWERFTAALGDRVYEYEHLAVYLTFRYFLKASFDENALVKVWQMIAMVLMMAALGLRRWQQEGALPLREQIDVVREYSKEVEYSDDNMEALAEALLFEPELKPEVLLGLLEG